MSGWYVKRDERRFGPYTSTQMVEMARKGQVLPVDWVSRGDGGQWFPASQVKGLFPVPATTAPATLPVADEQPVEAEDRPIRRKRAAHPNRTPVILACAGGAFLVVAGVVLAVLAGSGGKAPEKGGGSPSGGGRSLAEKAFAASSAKKDPSFKPAAPAPGRTSVTRSTSCRSGSRTCRSAPGRRPCATFPTPASTRRCGNRCLGSRRCSPGAGNGSGASRTSSTAGGIRVRTGRSRCTARS